MRPDLEFGQIPADAELEDIMDSALIPLVSSLPSLKQSKVDSFDVLTIPDAKMFVASELVKSQSKQTPDEQQETVNELLNKITGGKLFIDSLDQLKDGKIIAQLLMAANLEGSGLEKFLGQNG